MCNRNKTLKFVFTSSFKLLTSIKKIQINYVLIKGILINITLVIETAVDLYLHFAFYFSWSLPFVDQITIRKRASDMLNVIKTINTNIKENKTMKLMSNFCYENFSISLLFLILIFCCNNLNLLCKTNDWSKLHAEKKWRHLPIIFNLKAIEQLKSFLFTS